MTLPSNFKIRNNTLLRIQQTYGALCLPTEINLPKTFGILQNQSLCQSLVERGAGGCEVLSIALLSLASCKTNDIACIPLQSYIFLFIRKAIAINHVVSLMIPPKSNPLMKCSADLIDDGKPDRSTPAYAFEKIQWALISY
jgi:hypothetical protein